ncbi:MAG: dihydropteroate synthase [Woeseia sp.]
MHLRLGSRILDLDRPRVMGVINVTPDSFSDGGRYLEVDAAVSRAGRMQAAGADIIDVGGESTRPGAETVPEGEELDRVVPVIEAIAGRCDVAISIDSSKPAVMHAAVDAGATMINDVCALTGDGALASASKLDAAVCLMHMQGEPRTMQENPAYKRFPGDILAFLSGRVAACRQAGIGADRIVIDPGFGFGKTHEHNVRLLADLEQFQELEMPLLVGLSRKSTLGHLTGKGLDDRLSSGVAAAVMAVERGANIVRTHDVEATVDALRIVDAVMQSGRDE